MGHIARHHQALGHACFLKERIGGVVAREAEERENIKLASAVWSEARRTTRERAMPVEHRGAGTAPAGSYNNHFRARIGLWMRSLCNQTRTDPLPVSSSELPGREN